MHPTALSRALAAALALALPLDPALAAAAQASPKTLDKLTVAATRSPRKTSEVVAAVDVVEAEELEAELSRDLKDALRYLPGVSVRDNAGRFGLADINVRGLDGNRVLIAVDGVRVADAFRIGSFSSANRNFVDMDMLKSVEVVRGAASALHGSQAIGGVVSFVTKDPADLLRGRANHLGAKFGTYSDNAERVASATLAAERGAFSYLLHGVGRRSHEAENQGGNRAEDASRTALNPQDARHGAALAKFVWVPAPDQSLRLTLDRDEGYTDTEVYSARTTLRFGPSTVRVLDLDGEDRQERERVQLDWAYTPALPGLARGELKLYRQDSATRQDTFESRESTMPVAGQPPRVTPAERYRRFDFAQELTGLSASLEAEFATGAVGHRLAYGLDRLETDTAQRRDGYQRNPATGAQTPVVPPDAFPVRDFPLSTTTETGIYVQDELAWQDLSLVPGLRYDRLELDARLDPVFAGDNPGSVPSDQDEHALSPKLGALYRFGGGWSAFGQWATGFRAPPYADVNIGFTNLQFGYRAIANPALKSEQSRNAELGLRRQGEAGFWELTLFQNRYADFIESLAVVAVDPVTRVTTFQARNRHRARIEGAELRGLADLDAAWGWPGWRARAALSYARGEDRDSGRPLDSVDPAKAVLGLGWDAPSGDFGLELVATAVRRKTEVDESAGPRFESPGYAAFDLLGHWRFSEQATLRLGLFNLADKTYWDWADVRGTAADSPVLDRYTRPGRSAGLSLNLDF